MASHSMKKVYWSRTKLIRPESEQAKKNVRHQAFLPSYEQEDPQMTLILSWHYGRQWLEEHQTHERNIRQKTNGARFIPPDFDKWLEKRKPTKTRHQRAAILKSNY